MPASLRDATIDSPSWNALKSLQHLVDNSQDLFSRSPTSMAAYLGTFRCVRVGYCSGHDFRQELDNPVPTPRGHAHFLLIYRFQMQSSVIQGSFSTKRQFNISTLADRNRVFDQYRTRDDLLRYMELKFVEFNQSFVTGLKSLEKPAKSSGGAKRKHPPARSIVRSKRQKTH